MSPKTKTQACPWEWDSYGNPMGNVPWDRMGQDSIHLYCP